MRSIKKIVEVLIVVLIVGGFAFFAYQNAQPVAVHFFGKNSPELPIFMLLLISLVVGILIAGFLSLAEILRLNSRLRKQEKLTRALEKQLTLMKQQPLMEDFDPRLSLSEKGGMVERDSSEDFVDDDEDVPSNRQLYPRIR